ncbi:MAG: hypothetical protein H6751_05170 [Candidatus Omnitrophica bacterium]|nr:hypothetical protein [Candidatus Omnitrophota bacterium]
MREYLPPPTLLYYGCRRKPYRVYSEKGIEPTDGREIVLARTPEMALRIGNRRDPKPILVEINTEIAASQGAHFLSYGAQLFLVDRLPKDAMFGPPVKEEDLLPEKAEDQTKGLRGIGPDRSLARLFLLTALGPGEGSTGAPRPECRG